MAKTLTILIPSMKVQSSVRLIFPRLLTDDKELVVGTFKQQVLPHIDLRNRVLIRWGSYYETADIAGSITYNSLKSVIQSTNKRLSRQMLSDAGVSVPRLVAPGSADDDYEDGDEDWYGDEDEYLTPEQRWFLANPLKGLTALYNKSYAESIANKFPGIHNGYGDAVRHALFTALNANAFGATYAIELGIAHELSGSNNPIEYAMDIHNNQWGANYGSSHDTIDIGEFMDDFNDAVLNGQIIILDFDGNIPDPSSEIDDFVYDGSEHYSGNE